MIRRTSPFITIHDHHKLPNHHPPFISFYPKQKSPSNCLEYVSGKGLQDLSYLVEPSCQSAGRPLFENVGWSDMRSSSRNCCSNNRTFETAMYSCFVICGVLLLYYYYIYIYIIYNLLKKSFTRDWWENGRKTSRNAWSLQNTNQKWKLDAELCVWQYPFKPHR